VLCGPVPIVVFFLLFLALAIVRSAWWLMDRDIEEKVGVLLFGALMACMALGPVIAAVSISERWRPIRSRLLVGLGIWVVSISVNVLVFVVLLGFAHGGWK